MECPPRRGSPIALVLALVLGTIVGCETYQPAPPPPPPLAPRAVTVTAQRKQSQARQDRDKAECQSQASAQASSSQGWVEIFTACMSGRGYLVE